MGSVKYTCSGGQVTTSTYTDASCQTSTVPYTNPITCSFNYIYSCSTSPTPSPPTPSPPTPSPPTPSPPTPSPPTPSPPTPSPPTPSPPTPSPPTPSPPTPSPQSYVVQQVYASTTGCTGAITYAAVFPTGVCEVPDGDDDTQSSYPYTYTCTNNNLYVNDFTTSTTGCDGSSDTSIVSTQCQR